jgi:hypothetical protein
MRDIPLIQSNIHASTANTKYDRLHESNLPDEIDRGVWALALGGTEPDTVKTWELTRVN